jgi:hypothetical protein
VRRIRIQGQSALACGGPSLVFAREGNRWREVPTGITERVHFCDALQHGPDLWLVTMAGDVWRSRDGKATKVLSGEPGSLGSDEYRFDLRPFGAGLAIANGTSKVHLWDGERLSSVSLPGVGDEALRWLAPAGPNELWVASENRLFVGDGRQWFEPALPSDRPWIHGLCADPSGGVWITGTKRGPMVLRATVAGGVQAMDCPASSEHGFVLSDPSPHRGGVLAVSLEEWMTFRPSQVGMALSLRLDLDFDDLVTLDRSDTFFAVLNQLVAGWGGWSEG